MKKVITDFAHAEVGRTFLWMSILLRELRNLRTPSLKDVREKIEQLPAEMDDLYTNLIRKVSKSPRCAIILTWITYALRQVTFKELEVAVAVTITEHATSWKDCEEEKAILNAEAIRTILRSLVDVIDDRPFLIHQMLRGFLRRPNILQHVGSLHRFKQPEMLLADEDKPKSITIKPDMEDIWSASNHLRSVDSRLLLNPQMRLVIESGADGRQENLPTVGEVALIRVIEM
ncbi:hypothetical protein ACMFMF_004056 [Clarireedia jacksonii]